MRIMEKKMETTTTGYIGFRVEGLGLRVEDLEFRIQGFGYGV